MIQCLLVGAGGFVGSVCRYLIGLMPIGPENGFPVKTLLINIVGAFVISVVAIAATKDRPLDPQLVLLLKTGLCGGFTTFSTFAYETVELLKAGNWMLALGYVVASVVLGIAAVFAAEMMFR